MTNNDIELYENAKKGVHDWLVEFSKLHASGNSFKEFVENSSKEKTAFYKWYSTAGKKLNVFDTHRVLEDIYDEMFEEFEEYMEILEEPDKKSFFGSRKKKKLNSKAKNIKHHAKKLITTLGLYGSVVRNISSRKSSKEIQEEFSNTDHETFIEELDNSLELKEQETIVNDDSFDDGLLSEESSEVVEETVVQEENIVPEDVTFDIEEELPNVEEVQIIEEPELSFEETEVENVEVEDTIEVDSVEESNSAAAEEEEEIETKTDGDFDKEIAEIKRKMEEDFESKLKELGL